MLSLRLIVLLTAVDPFLASIHLHSALTNSRRSLAPCDMHGDVIDAAGLLPAVRVQFYTIGIFINNRVMVVNVAKLGARSNLASAETDSAYRILILHDPGANIEHVHMLLDVEIPRQPREVVPIAHMIFHVRPIGLARLDPDRSAKIVCLQSPNPPKRA